MSRIGIYLGSSSDDVANIDNVLRTWVRYMIDAGHNIELIGGTNVPSFSSASVIHQDVSSTSSVTPFGKIKDSYGHLSRYISEYNPDALIQIWKYQTHAPAVSIAGKRYGIPTAVRLTGDIFQEYIGYDFPTSLGVFALDNMVGRIPLYTASKFVVLGPSLMKSVQSRGISKERIHLIPPPRPDISRFSSEKTRSKSILDLDIDADRPLALFVGRLSQQKGMEFLSKVIDETLRQTEYQFILIGDGPYQEILRKRFSPEQVVMPGYVPHEQIPEYFRAASVYVHPSQFEGIPLVILEALESDVPVIARDAGDVDFVIENVVQTEQQMVNCLTQRDWNDTWQNKDHFSSIYQSKQITQLIKGFK